MSVAQQTPRVDAQSTQQTVVEEYLRRREARQQTLDRHIRSDLRMSHARTAVAIAALLLVWLAFGLHLLSGWWMCVPVAVFVVLMVLHERILQAKQRAERAVAFYDAGLRRLENRWIGRGVIETDFAPADHP